MPLSSEIHALAIASSATDRDVVSLKSRPSMNLGSCINPLRPNTVTPCAVITRATCCEQHSTRHHMHIKEVD
jgi:hypothetical protein